MHSPELLVLLYSPLQCCQRAIAYTVASHPPWYLLEHQRVSKHAFRRQMVRSDGLLWSCYASFTHPFFATVPKSSMRAGHRKVEIGNRADFTFPQEESDDDRTSLPPFRLSPRSSVLLHTVCAGLFVAICLPTLHLLRYCVSFRKHC